MYNLFMIETRRFTNGEVMLMGQLDYISRGFFMLDQRVQLFGQVERDFTNPDGEKVRLTITPKFLFGMRECMEARRKDLRQTGLDAIAESIIDKNKDNAQRK